MCMLKCVRCRFLTTYRLSDEPLREQEGGCDSYQPFDNESHHSDKRGIKDSSTLHSMESAHTSSSISTGRATPPVRVPAEKKQHGSRWDLHLCMKCKRNRTRGHRGPNGTFSDQQGGQGPKN